MKFAIVALMTLVSLNGCTTASFDSLACPDVITYTDNQLQQAASELEDNNVPMLTELVRDYCVMRDQSRVCAGQKAVCTEG